MEKYLSDFKRYLILRNYTTATIKSYVSSLKNFFEFCYERRKRDTTYNKERILEEYLVYCLRIKSFATVNGAYSAIKTVL